MENNYKKILNIKDIFDKELYFFYTVDKDNNERFGLDVVTRDYSTPKQISIYFTKEDFKKMIDTISSFLEELEKPKQEETLTDDEIIRDLENNIYNLQERVSNLERSLYIQKSTDNKNNLRNNWNYPNLPPIICKRD